VALGVAMAAHVPLADALAAYLTAFAANLVSAGVRLIPLGQTDGQLSLAALEPVVALAAPGWAVLLALPLRVLAGLAVGVLLAFGAHYLDPHLRTRSDAERLGLTVLGQIPRRNGQ
jgi:urease accessory protein UreF